MDNHRLLTILDLNRTTHQKDLDYRTILHNLQHLLEQLQHKTKTKNIGNTKRTKRKTKTIRL